MLVFLTGGTGFVGAHVARALVAAGHRVRALRRRTSRFDALLPVEWVVGDVLDPASLDAGMVGCEAVIHTAAAISMRGKAAAVAEARQVNVEGTRNVIAAARKAGARRFVFTSSVAAIGKADRDGIADEDQPYNWAPGAPYREAKRDSEKLALAAAGPDFEVVALNPSLVLGPDEPGKRFVPFMRAIRFGLGRLSPPGGTTIADVRDVADAHVAALTRGRSGARYILGGAHVQYREFISLFAKALDAPGPLVTVPLGAIEAALLPVYALRALMPLRVRPEALSAAFTERYYSSARAVAELGYHTRPAAEIIGDAVASYRSAGAL